ncbi:MAG: ABC transporter ATP-binding protein [Bacteroidota bacterium]
MIKTISLSKSYRGSEFETLALDQVSLSVKFGEFVAIMGPSGCGKSTLLNILGLIDLPTEGTYHFLGRDVSHCEEEALTDLRKDHIGFVFQRFNLLDDLTVFENVELPLIYAEFGRRQRKEKVEEVLERLGMMHRRNHFPQQLSGGQQQRVAVCRALVNQPALLLADEPTGNLDTQNGNDVMKLLVELNEQGTTVIMVTHSQRHADFADRVVRLMDGRIVSESTMIM